MVTWVLFALNVAAIDTQSNIVSVQPIVSEESRDLDILENFEGQFDVDDPASLIYLAMQMRAAGGSQLGPTGSFKRDSRPTFGRHSGYVAHRYHQRRVYRKPPPLITSREAARLTVARDVARTTWGGRRRW